VRHPRLAPRERDELQLRAPFSCSRPAAVVHVGGANGSPALARVMFGVGLFLIAASLNSRSRRSPRSGCCSIHLLQNALIADSRRCSFCSGSPLRCATGSTHGLRHCAPATHRLARRVVRDAHRGLLRLGAAHGLGAQHRARAAHPRRPALLVAARLRPPLTPAGARIPRRRLRRLVVPRSGAHLLEPGRSIVLRARSASGACRRSRTRTSAGS
jgi:hypothetical protein